MSLFLFLVCAMFTIAGLPAGKAAVVPVSVEFVDGDRERSNPSTAVAIADTTSSLAGAPEAAFEREASLPTTHVDDPPSPTSHGSTAPAAPEPDPAESPPDPESEGEGEGEEKLRDANDSGKDPFAPHDVSLRVALQSSVVARIIDESEIYERPPDIDDHSARSPPLLPRHVRARSDGAFFHVHPQRSRVQSRGVSYVVNVGVDREKTCRAKHLSVCTGAHAAGPISFYPSSSA